MEDTVLTVARLLRDYERVWGDAVAGADNPWDVFGAPLQDASQPQHGQGEEDEVHHAHPVVTGHQSR